MKNASLIATLGAASVAGMASAAVTTYTQFSNVSPNGWYQDALAISGGYYDPGTFSNFNTTTNSGGFGWETFTVSVTNGTLSFTGGNLEFASSSSSVEMDVLFSFSGGTNPPVSPNGIYGFGINFSVAPTTSNWIGVGVNGASVGNGSYGNGFVGVIATTSGAPATAPIQTVRFSFQSGSTATITGTQYAIVPTPGALALLGAAGLATARRRRA
jgi:uncharacterized protein (TIGR03382 family)